MSNVIELLPDRAAIEKRHATAFRNLEHKVHDIDRMGEITERLVADWCQEVTNERCLELANFAVQHLADMLREFKTNYYAAWEGKSQQGGS